MANIPQSENLILAALPPADFELLRPNLRTVDLPLGQTIITAGEIPTAAYFPHSGVIASMIRLKTCRAVEVGLTGRDGALGAVTEAEQCPSFTSAVVRLSGQSSTIDHADLKIAFDRSPALRALLAWAAAYQQAASDQSVACNAAHDLEARLARRLMRFFAMSDQAKFTATQEVLAEMLGVHRNAVSAVAHAMREANIIRYSRGLFEIVDVDRLHGLSCECYDIVSAYRDALKFD
jgi:CRP-like cAMP-binding protein